MRIQDIIEGKREWRAHIARVKALPQDYQIVYKEIQKYLFKVGPVELTNDTGLLSGIIDLIKDSKTYADIYQESVDQEVNKAMKKVTDKLK